jgi:hypothetical protein
MIRTIAASAAIGVLALAGCASAQQSHNPAPRPTTASAAPSAPAAPEVTCADLAPIIKILVADQRNQDSTYQEKWVMGNQGDDLNVAIDKTEGVTGTSLLSTDAGEFNADATSYLADNSGYLAPGWQSEYKTVKADIAALATDCSIPHRHL